MKKDRIYSAQMRALMKYRQNPGLSPGAGSLMEYLLYRRDYFGWPDTLYITNNELFDWLGIKDVKSLNKIRNELVSANLLIYTKGSKGHPGEYTLATFVSDSFGKWSPRFLPEGYLGQYFDKKGTDSVDENSESMTQKRSDLVDENGRLSSEKVPDSVDDLGELIPENDTDSVDENGRLILKNDTIQCQNNEVNADFCNDTVANTSIYTSHTSLNNSLSHSQYIDYDYMTKDYKTSELAMNWISKPPRNSQEIGAFMRDLAHYWNYMAEGTRIEKEPEFTRSHSQLVLERLNEYGVEKLFVVVDKVGNTGYLNGSVKSKQTGDFFISNVGFVFGKSHFRDILSGRYDKLNTNSNRESSIWSDLMKQAKGEETNDETRDIKDFFGNQGVVSDVSYQIQ